MFGQLLQPMHLLLIVGIALLVFGPSKLPQLGASIGKGIRELRKGLDGTPDQPAQPTQPTQSTQSTQSTDTRK
jgi:sec-independent protein translocase protein TatA